MKMVKTMLPKALKMILVMTVLCGVIYHLVITVIAQSFFKEKADGSIIKVKGVAYGSELLGQQYTGNEYLWGRIMIIDTETFTDKNGKKLMYANPSNISPASGKYGELIEERVKKIKQADPDADMKHIPVDLVSCSGSGIDPHISLAAAEFQITRIAKSRNMSEENIARMIEKYTTGRTFGIFGEKVVNVLKVNLELDGILED